MVSKSKSKSKSILKNISLWDIVIVFIIGLLICSFLRSFKVIEGVDGDTNPTPTPSPTPSPNPIKSISTEDGKCADDDKTSGRVPGITCPLTEKNPGATICIGKFPSNDKECTGEPPCLNDYCDEISPDTYKPKDPYLKGYDHRVLRAIVNNLGRGDTKIENLQTLMNNKSIENYEIPILLEEDGDKTDIDRVSVPSKNILEHIEETGNSVFNSKIVKYINDKKNVCSTGYDKLGKVSETIMNINKSGELVGYNKQDGLYCMNSLYHNNSGIDFSNPKIFLGPKPNNYCSTGKDVCYRSDIDYNTTPSGISTGQQALNVIAASANTCDVLKNPRIGNYDSKISKASGEISDWTHYWWENKVPSLPGFGCG